MMGFWADSGISWTICKLSAPRSRQITSPTPHHFFTGQMLFLMPNQQCLSTGVILYTRSYLKISFVVLQADFRADKVSRDRSEYSDG